jgi:TRAP-type C4-dicarboxylate transport system permease small subunit
VVLVQSLPIIARTSVQRSPAMQIQMSHIYLIVPIFAGLIMVFLLLRWLEAARTGRMPVSGESKH